MKKDKILLIALASQGRSGFIAGHQLQKIRRRPIIGLLYISSAAESIGVETEILDQYINPFTLDDIRQQVEKNKYLLVGFYSPVVKNNSEASLETIYASYLKKHFPELTIVAGGPGTYFHGHFLDRGFDIVCKSEGDETLKDIIRYTQGKLKLSQVKGIAYREKDKVFTNPDREPIADLSTIPYPDWPKVDLKLYKDHFIPTLRHPSAPVTASRGCPLRCAFCYSPNFWRYSHRVRPIPELLGEIDLLVNKYKVKYILFQDPIFGWDTKWLAEFCEALTLRKYRKLKWMCHLHPLIFRKGEYDLIRKMKLAGCNLIHLGLQSADDQILKNINRSPSEPAILKEIIAVARANKIMTAVDFIIGLPGENRRTVRKNIEYALDSKADMVHFNPLYLEVGTELFENKDKMQTAFSEDEIVKICARANREFYLNFKTICRLSIGIIQNNPRFLLHALLRARMVL